MQVVIPFDPRGENRLRDSLAPLLLTSGLRLYLFLLSIGRPGEEGLVLLRVGLVVFLTKDDNGTVAFSGWCFTFMGELLRFGL